MKITRFFKTIFMTDFLGGLFIAIKEIFKSKKAVLLLFKIVLEKSKTVINT